MSGTQEPLLEGATCYWGNFVRWKIERRTGGGLGEEGNAGIIPIIVLPRPRRLCSIARLDNFARTLLLPKVHTRVSRRNNLFSPISSQITRKLSPHLSNKQSLSYLTCLPEMSLHFTKLKTRIARTPLRMLNQRRRPQEFSSSLYPCF